MTAPQVSAPTSPFTAAAQQATTVAQQPAAAAVTQQVDPDDAYWAAQPPEVRALRNIEDPEQCRSAAIDLARKGYTIDVPIMVWGWSASKTMAMRQQWGYTWVPSATMQPVAAAPGIDFPGAAKYDTTPPPGAIRVA